MISVKLQGYDDALKILDDKPVRKAAQISLRKVSASAKSTASEEVRNVYNIKKADLDPRIKNPQVRADNLVAEIIISGKGASLSYFGARQTLVNRVITRGKKGLQTKTMKRSAKFQGVEVSVMKGQKTQLKSAFMVTMKSGHVGVMHRTGKKRLPIQEKQVISIVSMVQNAKVEPAVLAKVNEQWGKVFPHELNRQLGLEKG